MNEVQFVLQVVSPAKLLFIINIFYIKSKLVKSFYLAQAIFDEAHTKKFYNTNIFLAAKKKSFEFKI